MNNSLIDRQISGLAFFSDSASFLSDLSEADESMIAGGGRSRSNSRSRRRPRRRRRRAGRRSRSRS